MPLLTDVGGLITGAQALHDRGYTPGNTGNLSIRTQNGFIITPTNSCLGRLRTDELATLTDAGRHQSGSPPSKEWGLHLAMYAAHPGATAVVHLHSANAVAVSCLAELDSESVFPVMTAYQLLRVRDVRLVRYAVPGSSELVDAVARAAVGRDSLLLANHGPIVARASLDEAIDAIEQLEQTAQVMLLLHGREITTPVP